MKEKTAGLKIETYRWSQKNNSIEKSVETEVENRGRWKGIKIRKE